MADGGSPAGKEGLSYATPREHRAHFICTLCCGFVLSSSWFLLNFIIAQQHEVDSEVINFAGRLRFLTQHVGLLALRTSLGIPSNHSGLLSSDIDAAFRQIDRVCDGLLGRDKNLGIPEILDSEVQVALGDWSHNHLSAVRQIVQNSPLNLVSQGMLVDRVDIATGAMDGIVNTASDHSRLRVKYLMGISIARVLVGVGWALCTAHAFQRLWCPYAATYNRLQAAERELKSLLKAAFDVVVPVGAEAPFEVRGSERELCHFLGRSVGSCSVLDLAVDAGEQAKLREFLLSGLSVQQPEEEETPPRRWSRCCKNGKLLQNTPPLPVAPMVRSRWTHGAGAGMNVEVLMVSGRRKEAFLAVRSLEEAPDEGGANLPAAVTTPPQQRPEVTEITVGIEQRVHPRRPLPSHSTESAETATGMLPVLSPRSELENTPPPTLIGAARSLDVRLAVPVQGLAASLQYALEDYRQQHGSASSGSSTPTGVGGQFYGQAPPAWGTSTIAV